MFAGTFVSFQLNVVANFIAFCFTSSETLVMIFIFYFYHFSNELAKISPTGFPSLTTGYLQNTSLKFSKTYGIVSYKTSKRIKSRNAFPSH